MFQIYAAFNKDFPQFAIRIDKSNRDFDKLIKDSFTKKKMDDIVKHRSELICSIFPGNVVDGEKNIKTIDIFMCINEMLSVVVPNSNVIYSVKTKTSCSTIE